jgi:hypothetical protein
MRLGEISAKNTPEASVNKISGSLRGIQLVSKIYYDEGPSTLKIVDDIDISTDVIQTSGVGRNQDSDSPDTKVFYCTGWHRKTTKIHTFSIDRRSHLRCQITSDTDTVWFASQTFPNNSTDSGPKP